MSLNEIIALALPPRVVVAWSCRRCGHTGGRAQTTIPLDPHWTEAMGRELFAQLRRKLVRVHQRQGCIALPEDFQITPVQSQEVIGRV